MVFFSVGLVLNVLVISWLRMGLLSWDYYFVVGIWFVFGKVGWLMILVFDVYWFGMLIVDNFGVI